MPSLKWAGSCYLSIDPGINVTGFSRYDVSLTGISKLVRYGAIIPPESENNYEQINYIVDSVSGFDKDFKPGFILVEQPPSTVYGGKQLSKDMLIARAQSVFKTVAVAASILATLRHTSRALRVPILPVQWQENIKRHKGLTSKEWSLREANKILIADMQRPANTLHTKQDENIADSITMGRRVFDNGMCP